MEVSSSKTIEGKAKLHVTVKGGFKFFGAKTELEGGGEGERGKREERTTEPLDLDASDPK